MKKEIIYSIKVLLYSFAGTGIGLLALMYIFGFSNIKEGEIFLFTMLWIILSIGIAAVAIWEEYSSKDLYKKDKMSLEKENIFAISSIIAVIPSCICLFLILTFYNTDIGGGGLTAKTTVATIFLPLLVLFSFVFRPIVGKIYKK
jgi:hypothetical protein